MILPFNPLYLYMALWTIIVQSTFHLILQCTALKVRDLHDAYSCVQLYDHCCKAASRAPGLPMDSFIVGHFVIHSQKAIDTSNTSSYQVASTYCRKVLGNVLHIGINEQPAQIDRPREHWFWSVYDIHQEG